MMKLFTIMVTRTLNGSWVFFSLDSLPVPYWYHFNNRQKRYVNKLPVEGVLYNDLTSFDTTSSIIPGYQARIPERQMMTFEEEVEDWRKDTKYGPTLQRLEKREEEEIRKSKKKWRKSF